MSEEYGCIFEIYNTVIGNIAGGWFKSELAEPMLQEWRQVAGRYRAAVIEVGAAAEIVCGVTVFICPM